MTEAHRILVCGAGSVGERHIQNLMALGHTDIALYRRSGRPLRTISADLPVFTDLDQALALYKPTVAFITNPTALHIPTALRTAEAACHLFIEKPLSDSLDDIDVLQAVLYRHRRVAMTGYMMRFHPLLQQAKSWLDSGELGEPLYARASWGEHVPDWHPWEDYRDGYAVRDDLGGGPALTLSHEIDLLAWMLGSPTESVSLASLASPLEAGCEQAVDILMRFEHGATASVHLDFWQRPPHRSWELVCSRARLVFRYLEGTLTRWDATVGNRPPRDGPTEPRRTDLKVPDGYDRNDMFVAELRYFFDCLRLDRTPQPGLEEAAEIVRLACDARQQRGLARERA